MSDYIDGFRFSCGYEDVFIEAPGVYLYVCAQLDGRAWQLSACEYRQCGDLDDSGEMREWTYGHVTCDAEYALSLEHAPYPVARQIVNAESRIDARIEAARTGEDADELYKLIEIAPGDFAAA